MPRVGPTHVKKGGSGPAPTRSLRSHTASCIIVSLGFWILCTPSFPYFFLCHPQEHGFLGPHFHKRRTNTWHFLQQSGQFLRLSGRPPLRYGLGPTASKIVHFVEGNATCWSDACENAGGERAVWPVARRICLSFMLCLASTLCLVRSAVDPYQNVGWPLDP